MQQLIDELSSKLKKNKSYIGCERLNTSVRFYFKTIDGTDIIELSFKNIQVEDYGKLNNYL